MTEPITREQLKVLSAERSRAQSKYDAALKQWKRQKREENKKAIRKSVWK